MTMNDLNKWFGKASRVASAKALKEVSDLYTARAKEIVEEDRKIIVFLVSHSGKEWESGDMHRVYLSDGALSSLCGKSVTTKGACHYDVGTRKMRNTPKAVAKLALEAIASSKPPTDALLNTVRRQERDGKREQERLAFEGRMRRRKEHEEWIDACECRKKDNKTLFDDYIKDKKNLSFGGCRVYYYDDSIVVEGAYELISPYMPLLNEAGFRWDDISRMWRGEKGVVKSFDVVRKIHAEMLLKQESHEQKDFEN